MYVCMYVYMCMYVCMYICMYVYMYICMCVYAKPTLKEDTICIYSKLLAMSYYVLQI